MPHFALDLTSLHHFSLAMLVGPTSTADAMDPLVYRVCSDCPQEQERKQHNSHERQVKQ